MKWIYSIILIFSVAIVGLAQPREGKNKELSISGCYQNYSSGSSSQSSGALLLSPRIGFYVKGGLELEPEMVFMFPSSGDAVYMVNGNISYNFISAGRGVPFLLLGYGISNTVPLFNVPITKTDFGLGVLNVGCGIKAFIADNVAIRIEYRYQNFSGEGEETYFGYSYEQNVDLTIHTVQFGFSILL